MKPALVAGFNIFAVDLLGKSTTGCRAQRGRVHLYDRKKEAGPLGTGRPRASGEEVLL